MCKRAVKVPYIYLYKSPIYKGLYMCKRALYISIK